MFREALENQIFKIVIADYSNCQKEINLSEDEKEE